MAESKLTYSSTTAFLAATNVMFGSGVTTLPYTVCHAGILPSLFAIIIGFFFNMLSVSYVIEGLGAANAAHKDALIDKGFAFSRRIEIGAIVTILTNKTFGAIFYIVIIVYLYGILCIHSIEVGTAVSSIFAVWGWDVGYFAVITTFYIIVLLFSLRNIANVTIVNYIIITAKFTVVVLYFVGSIYAAVNLPVPENVDI